jgi:hypothetical protein
MARDEEGALVVQHESVSYAFDVFLQRRTLPFLLTVFNIFCCCVNSWPVYLCWESIGGYLALSEATAQPAG